MKKLTDYIGESISVNERQFKPKNGYKFIDLGLPSGTLWADANEEGYHTFDEAVSKYGDSLPTKEQYEELKKQCQWKWMGDGYEVTGPNHKSIFLPAEGFRFVKGGDRGMGCYGNYWSSTPDDSKNAWCIDFNSGIAYMNNYYKLYGLSVRLVKGK